VDYLRGGSDEPRTRYVVVTGPGTAFDGERATRLDEIHDGPSNTLLLVESPGDPVDWMRPDDIAPEELVRLLATTPREAFPHGGRFFALLANGEVRSLSRDLPPETLRGLCTIDGGEPADGF
ncbi:MAG TPA: hypothetical protein VML55_06900, partial [Planctomycetaceae bacterium]|nr:hypothetical protein [Planctomycetaceae bacterium]